jgi:signal transduction histidine kinase
LAEAEKLSHTGSFGWNVISGEKLVSKEMGNPGRLTIATRQDEKRQLLISVTDTGVGVPPGQREQIFNAFFSSKLQGTGMGLRISRSIIESHGGRLWATSNSGPGATFQFTLPVEAAARQSA